MDRKVFTFRTSEILFNKLVVLANNNKRSTNAQIDFILEEYINEYEKENGAIKTEK